MHPLLFGRAADSVLPRPVLLSDTGNLAIISLAATQGRSSCCPAGLPGFRGRRPAHHSQAAEPQPRAPSTPQGQEVAHTGGTHTAVEPMGQEARGPSSTLAEEEWAGAGGGHSSSAWGPAGASLLHHQGQRMTRALAQTGLEEREEGSAVSLTCSDTLEGKSLSTEGISATQTLLARARVPTAVQMRASAQPAAWQRCSRVGALCPVRSPAPGPPTVRS